MKNTLKKKIFRIGLPIIILGGIVAGLGFSSDNYFEISKNIDIYTSIYHELNTYYVDEINSSKLMRKGIDAMLKSLDPYTVYFPESEIEDYRVMTTGEYGGIGAVISKKGPYIQVVEPYKNYPANKADLRAGDLILKIDDNEVEGKTSDEVSHLLKGQPGTKVVLKIKRPGSEETMEKSIVREEIKMPDVPYYGMIGDGIGYIKFIGFRQDASEEVKDALLKLKSEQNLKGVVLDLRDNPGGILNEAVKTVSWFVPKGELVVTTKGKAKEWDKTYRTYTPPVDLDLPLAILVNGHSASASEIVAGAIQDLDRGVIIGQQTFGKGLVQQAKSLPYNAKLKLTIAKYYTPSGRCIQALDYSNRDENGRVTKIPDSLRSEFKTKNGRIVYDGAGIFPDIKVDKKDFPEIIKSLISQQLIFDYATYYRNKTDQIPDPKEFSISDEEYNNFIKFLKDKSYDYTTDTERELEEFSEKAKEENYYDGLKDEITTLEKELKEDKKDDLIKYKGEISEILEEEIIGRYYFLKGRIEASLDDDDMIKQAISVINDNNNYKEILTSAEKK